MAICVLALWAMHMRYPNEWLRMALPGMSGSSWKCVEVCVEAHLLPAHSARLSIEWRSGICAVVVLWNTKMRIRNGVCPVAFVLGACSSEERQN